MKILNLYSGIGGNRKLWGNEHEITAVELDPKIAEIYADLFPFDTVVVEDAHQYLLDHFKEFDFIWSSPPCPSHSRTNYFLNSQGVVRYPDMKLYEEVILLSSFFKGKYVVENVMSYYEPLVKPQISGRHYFWANFNIPNISSQIQIGRMNGKKSELGNKSQNEVRSIKLDKLGFDLSKFSYSDKEKLLRNCVDPNVGLAIIQSATNSYNHSKNEQVGLFSFACP